MNKVSLFFEFSSYDNYSKYLNLLFEEYPELKSESHFYQSLQQHNKSINDLVSAYEQMDSNDSEQFYLFCFLPSLTIISTRKKKTLEKLLNFISEHDLKLNTQIRSNISLSKGALI